MAGQTRVAPLGSLIVGCDADQPRGKKQMADAGLYPTSATITGRGLGLCILRLCVRLVRVWPATFCPMLATYRITCSFISMRMVIQSKKAPMLGRLQGSCHIYPWLFRAVIGFGLQGLSSLCCCPLRLVASRWGNTMFPSRLSVQ